MIKYKVEVEVYYYTSEKDRSNRTYTLYVNNNDDMKSKIETINKEFGFYSHNQMFYDILSIKEIVKYKEVVVDAL